jgi:predicted acyl esterase
MMKTKNMPRLLALGLLLPLASWGAQKPPNNKSAQAASTSRSTASAGHEQKIEILYRKLPPLDATGANYPGLKPGETVLPKGYVYQEGRLPLASDTIFDRDVAIKMRDGVTLYADVYRPAGAEKVPAIVCIGSAGKGGHGSTAMASWPDAVTQSPAPAASAQPGGPGGPPPAGGKSAAAPARSKPKTSGLEAHLSLDPAQWVQYGYALAVVDERGAYMSGGDFEYFGPQLARDGYDVVEYLAGQKWSNGKVALAGAMWYGMTQWPIAAARPPHLAAIAPWDAGTDIYRDEFVRDGVGRVTSSIGPKTVGNGRSEDIGAMADTHPLLDAYWESKLSDLEKIDVPAYMTIAYTTQHTRGAIEAFNRIASKEKWLRVRTSEASSDIYEDENVADMRLFFDRYLKGAANGWTKTPRVRLSLIDPGGKDIVERAENEFPLLRQQPTKFYLDAASGKLQRAAPAQASQAEYNTDAGQGQAVFTIRFDKETEIAGFLKLRLWVEAKGANDMDLFATVKKLDANGQPLTQSTSANPFVGADGRLRVSQRQLDLKRSTPLEPVHTHKTVQLLEAGDIVPVEIQIWPAGIVFHAGEQLQLAVAGYDNVTEGRGQDRPRASPLNKGDHIIHTGGKYDSYLLAPVIPANRQSGGAAAALKP